MIPTIRRARARRILDDVASGRAGLADAVSFLEELARPAAKGLPPICYAAVSGGASHVATLAGALFRLAERRAVCGAAGVSAGAIVAAALAFGIPGGKVLELLCHLLSGNRVLDRQIGGPFVDGWGLCQWNVIRDEVGKLLGPKTTLGDSPVPLVVVVSDAYFRVPRYLSKRDTPSVSVVDALGTSSQIWPLAPMRPIPTWASVVGNRRFFDGGFGDNFPDHVFDEKEEPTVGLRLGGAPAEAVRLDSLDDAAFAALETMTYAAQQSKTKRDDGLTVDVDTTGLGSGFDFDLSPEVTRARYARGVATIDALPLDDGDSL